MEQSRLADGSDIIASNALLEDSPPYTAHPRAVGDQASGYHSDSDETEGGLQAGHVPVRSSVSDILSTWWLECLCAVLVVLALFALVFTLYSYQGRPLPHWPHQISINSLVALFVVILKAAMLLIITEGSRSAINRLIPSDSSCQVSASSNGPGSPSRDHCNTCPASTLPVEAPGAPSASSGPLVAGMSRTECKLSPVLMFP